MDINFDNLNKITVIEEMLIKISSSVNSMSQKKWLSTNEAAKYLSYSKDTIDRYVKTNEFKKGVHYHQHHGKRIFSTEALDSWVLGININSEEEANTINSIVDSVLKDNKAA